MITLYKHNADAYNAAVEMLRETGRAAVIHPTGTGKSFIGFKYCEDNPDKQVCWISPSEYIVKMQIENFKAAGGEDLSNIKFYTYAKLMNMTPAEMEAVKPGCIILDEFHRAGAAVWGAALKKFLRMYPDVPLLGFSATAVRYLDNRRDMADELFDGCVAGEMSLGEAIVRGILNPPKYVTSVYAYSEDLRLYENRVRNIKNGARRERAESVLESLRRALEQADGLDVIFKKYMPDPHGKYIVFCSDKNHMDEMMRHTEWFRLVDESPRVYSVYSDDPGAGESFDEFKKDRTPDHLRLLYCIDALNEGVHLSGINGVILLRPTVSPIIFKQQIGRALSAGDSNTSVIFDIVNNISGLQSIDAVLDEMRDVERYYRYLGESEYIVNDRFTITDTAEDCRQLFAELENTLSASWDFMYGEAKAYYNEHGDLLTPRDCVTAGGVKLGRWVAAQRINYRNKKGISRARIAKLEKIGMVWQTEHERQWEGKYLLAEKYFKEHGNLLPDRETEPGLCDWVIRQRRKQRDALLTDEQFNRLSAIGMVWEFEDSWERKFELAVRYREEHGNLDIPAAYVTEDGVRLGEWYRSVKKQYSAGTLPEERKRKLESAGIRWEPAAERSWNRYYALAAEYYVEHGDLNINANYETADGTKLGTWIAEQRHRYKTGRLGENRKRKLDAIGMEWRRFSSKWDCAYEYAKSYFAEKGDLNIPADCKTEDGFALGMWLASQRRKYAAGKLKPGRIKKLANLNMVWSVPDSEWRTGYEHAEAYFKANGDTNVPRKYICSDGYALGAWAAAQRRARKTGKLSPEREKRLDALGFAWDIRGDRWNIGYGYAKAYRAGGGAVPIPSGYVTEDGYPLGEWIRSQRRRYGSGLLESGKIQRLKEIGVLFDAV